MNVSFRLPHEPSSAGLARTYLRGVLDDWGTSERIEDAMLLVTELIANAVIHGSAEVRLDVDIEDSVLRVRVADGSPVLPRKPDASASGSGRGLAIVESLADKWGIAPNNGIVDGKTVWFELKG